MRTNILDIGCGNNKQAIENVYKPRVVTEKNYGIPVSRRRQSPSLLLLLREIFDSTQFSIIGVDPAYTSSRTEFTTIYEDANAEMKIFPVTLQDFLTSSREQYQKFFDGIISILPFQINSSGEAVDRIAGVWGESKNDILSILRNNAPIILGLHLENDMQIQRREIAAIEKMTGLKAHLDLRYEIHQASPFSHSLNPDISWSTQSIVLKKIL